MKRFFFVFVGLFMFSLINAQTNLNSYPWGTMNGDPNVIGEFEDNVWYAKEHKDISPISFPRIQKKYSNGIVDYVTVPFGTLLKDGIMYYGKDKEGSMSPKSWYGDIDIKITTVKDTKGNVVKSDKKGIPIYCKVVTDTLLYEEDPQTIENFIKERGLSSYLQAKDYDLEYQFLFFKNGNAGLPQCNNFIILKKLILRQVKIIAPPPVLLPPPVISQVPKKIIPLKPLVVTPTIVNATTSDIEYDVWVNTSGTLLKNPPPTSVFSDGSTVYNITRNYDARKAFDGIGGAKVTMSVNEDWQVSGEIGGGVLDGAGQFYVEILFKRMLEMELSSLSLGIGLRDDQWQFSYWTDEIFNIISPTQHSIKSTQHLPWINSFSIAGEIKLYSESDYAMIKGFVDPKEWNNYIAVEAKTEKRVYGYLLLNQQHFKPSKFIDTSSVVEKPERTNLLGEAKLGLEIKKTEKGNSIYCFVDGRLNHQEVQQPRVDRPYLYKYIRSDIGIGVQFPAYTENAQIIFSYVDIKDGDWKNYGWCIRLIWNIF